MKISILTFLILLILSGCASKPYAIIDGSRSKPGDQYTYDVLVGGVDGQLLMDTPTSWKVKPGTHLVQLISTKQGRRGDVTYQNWSFKAEACKRYIVVARHPQGKNLSNRVWSVELVKVEPILYCEKKMQQKVAKDT